MELNSDGDDLGSCTDGTSSLLAFACESHLQNFGNMTQGWKSILKGSLQGGKNILLPGCLAKQVQGMEYGGHSTTDGRSSYRAAT